MGAGLAKMPSQVTRQNGSGAWYRTSSSERYRMSTTLTFGSRLVAVTVRHPAVQVAAVLWIIANAVLLLLANGVLPFDRPALADTPFVQQVALPSLGLIEVFILMAVVCALTSRREIPDIAARLAQGCPGALDRGHDQT